MTIKELLTEEEIKDIENQESLLGQPNWDTVKYWMNKHYKELEIDQLLKLMELDYLQDIKLSIEYMADTTY